MGDNSVFIGLGTRQIPQSLQRKAYLTNGGLLVDFGLKILENTLVDHRVGGVVGWRIEKSDEDGLAVCKGRETDLRQSFTVNTQSSI